MNNKTLLKRGPSTLACLIIALFLALGSALVAATVTAAPASAYERSTTATVCIDGPNTWGQMYPVDCSRLQGFESDEVCHYHADSTLRCDSAAGVDSTTRCLYEFNHQVNPPGSVVTDGYEYENGLCAARGDTVDQNPYCSSHAFYAIGHQWNLDYTCPDFDPQPVVPEPADTEPTVEPEPTDPPSDVTPQPANVHLTIKAPATLSPFRSTRFTVVATDDDGNPIQHLELTICDTDQVTHKRRCNQDWNEFGLKGVYDYPVVGPKHATTITVTHAADQYANAASATSAAVRVASSVRTVLARKGSSRVIKVVTAPAVATILKLQRRTGNGYKTVRTLTSASNGTATFARLAKGQYRVLSVGDSNHTSAASKQVEYRPR